jgi:hypothetical protein
MADVDVPGNFCSNTLRLLRTTTNASDIMDVTLTDTNGQGNCAWNTNMTYDFGVLDINGDSRLDLWSGHARGNQVFLGEIAVDCDGNGIPDRCNALAGSTPGTENPVGACCYSTGKCKDTFRVCCDELGGNFRPQFSCVTYGCIQGP